MTNEENSEQVVDFALVPIGSIIETSNAGNWGCFIGVGLNADAGVVAYG